MTPETISVLRHWRQNWDKACDGTLTEGDINADECAYCQKYEDACTKGCPIYLETGEIGCNDTPYEDIEPGDDIQTLKSAVWAENQFLLGIAWKEGQPTSGGCKEKVGPEALKGE